jgi:plasmid stabilization system protein ParE
VDFQIRISDPALVDFEDILEYSWATFPVETERFGNAILKHIELLKTFPYIGNPVAGRPGIRLLIRAPILIYYRVHESPNLVEILHFWHASRKSPDL